MSSLRAFVAGAVLGSALAALAAWWWWPQLPASAPPAALAARPAAAPTEPAEPAARDVLGPAVAPAAAPAAAAAPSADQAHEPDAAAADAPPQPDLALYEREPMSRVPHRVVRGWGATEDRQQAGRVGVYVVVDPSISDQELIQLARDIRDYHGEANAVSARILDSEEAATYDYHEDGGVRREQHIVGRVSKDSALGVDTIEVRGNSVEP